MIYTGIIVRRLPRKIYINKYVLLIHQGTSGIYYGNRLIIQGKVYTRWVPIPIVGYAIRGEPTLFIHSRWWKTTIYELLPLSINHNNYHCLTYDKRWMQSNFTGISSSNKHIYYIKHGQIKLRLPLQIRYIFKSDIVDYQQTEVQLRLETIIDNIYIPSNSNVQLAYMEMHSTRANVYIGPLKNNQCPIFVYHFYHQGIQYIVEHQIIRAK